MRRVLIVDDDQVNLKFMEKVLKHSFPEYSFECVGGGQEALENVAANKPDIILLDVLMPDMSGFEVCKRLKAHQEYRTIPILLITGLDTVEQKVAGFKVGAADYITKPINVEEVKARVEAHLRIKTYHDELALTNDKLIKAQSALIESAKMSAVGSLAAGVAHEFNNILLMMSGYVQLYQENQDAADVASAFNVLSELIGRGEKIVKGLLDFSRRDDVQRKVSVDIREVLSQDLALLKKEIQKNSITVETTVPDELPNISCFPGQMSQVFVNVIRNAIDAMRDASPKTLKVELFVQDRPYKVMDDWPVKTGVDYVIVVFKDSGSGLPEDLTEKVFDPFVTTKGVLGGGDDSAPGTGLGLSISYGIMQRHQGAIHIENNDDCGAKVVLSLPLASVVQK